jgi:competence protein ComEC
VDTGGEVFGSFDARRELVAYLDGFFGRRVDLGRSLELVVLTHPHKDHTLGVAELLAHGIRVRRAVTNGQRSGSGKAGQKKLLDEVPAASRREIGFATLGDVAARTDAVIDPVDCRPPGDPGAGVDPVIKVLWGEIGEDPGWGYEEYDGKREDHHDDENNHSLVLRVDYGKASLLLTGDLEAAAIPDFLAAHAGGLVDVDVYQAGHHGSANGTTRELLAAMTPKVAVISMGPAGRTCAQGHWWQKCYTAYSHGHPRRGVVRELERHVTLSRRNPVTVQVAERPRTFAPQEVRRCVYGTGWTGTVVLTARASDGWIEVEEPAAEPCG